MSSPKQFEASDVAAGAKWKCDICSARFFDDYNEAMEHERQCRGSSPSPEPSAVVGPATANAVGIRCPACALVNNTPHSTVPDQGGDRSSKSDEVGAREAQLQAPRHRLHSIDLTTVSDSDDNAAAASSEPLPVSGQCSDAISSDAESSDRPLGEGANRAAEAALQTLCAMDADAVGALSEDLERKVTRIQRLLKDADDEQSGESHGMRKSRRGEMGRLRDHLVPGLHDHAPNTASSRKRSAGRSDEAVATRGEGAKRRVAKSTSDASVVNRRWNDEARVLVSDRPVHYRVVPQRVAEIANELKGDLLEHFDARKNSCVNSRMISTGHEVEPGSGYFKAHTRDVVSGQFRSLDILPAPLQIKRSASQKSIMFFNERDGQCDTHFDRDSSALYLVSGRKEVKIARPMRACDRPEDGILHGIDPFSPDRMMHGRFEWETFTMYPGAVVFLPKFWVHCVRSTGDPDTLALSFQVEIREGMRHLISWESRCEPAGGPSLLAALTSLDATSTMAAGATSKDTNSSANLKGAKSTVELEASQPWATTSAAATSTIVASRTGANSNPRANNLKYVKSRIKSEVSPSRPRSEFSFRKSSRQRPKCGLCGAGFCGEEMWVLQRNDLGTTRQTYLDNTEKRPDLPDCPTELLKHLVCMSCCERKILIFTGDPETEITYPDGKRRPILTKEEFRNLGHYGYYTASYVDYTTKYVNKGRSLLGRAGGEYTPELAERTMIKLEF